MTFLTLVRHGETDWNLARRVQGSTDIPLNETGRAQARAAALRLAEAADPAAPVIVAASDLSRARETAEIIAEHLGVDGPAAYPALRERAYGEAEGLTDTEFLARFGSWGSAEVPGAEPWDVVRDRAVAGVREIVRDARARTAPYGPHVIVVSHGATIRAVLRHATGNEVEGHITNGSAHTLLVERERLRLIASPLLAPSAS